MADPDSIRDAAAQTRAMENVARWANSIAGDMAQLGRNGMSAQFQDSFQNFMLQLGVGTGNAVFDGSTYGFNPITRVRTLLEWIHRGSWLGGTAVDLVADDMTKLGIDVTGDIADMPHEVEEFENAFSECQIWDKLNACEKWGRLYGGALGVLLVDGQDWSQPLDVSRVTKGQFRGILPLDRWMVEPQLGPGQLVTDLGPDLGLPKYYKITGFAPVRQGALVHYTRTMRFIGIQLPYWQSTTEQLWGVSVLERLYDRMVAFDSATMGAAQLVQKAHLRTFKVEGFKELAGMGGDAFAKMLRYVDMMRRFQGVEGMTIIDSTDEFMVDSHQGFAGVPEVVTHLAQQLSGALQIPMIRLLGESPTGLNSTGGAELRTYYDGIKQRQERDFRRPLNAISRMIGASEGIQLGDNFGFTFRPLWQLTEEGKAQVGATRSTSINQSFAEGIIDHAQALKEMRQLSRSTGYWATIQTEDVEAAEAEPPPGLEQLGPGGEPLGLPPGGQPPGLRPGAQPRGLRPPTPRLPGLSTARGQLPHLPSLRSATAEPREPDSVDESNPQPGPQRLHLHLVDAEASRIRQFQGLPIYVETRRGEIRNGRDWSVTMPADYGYISQTGSLDGRGEGLDCFVGQDDQAPDVWVIYQKHQDGSLDEHKAMLGYRTCSSAISDYDRAYDGHGFDMIDSVKKLTIGQFKDWLVNEGFAAAVAS